MSRPLPSRGDLVRCLTSSPRALHAREIASECGVPDSHYAHLLELLEQLSVDGTLRRLPGNRFKLNAAAHDPGGTWEGILTVHPRGFGFVNSVGHEDVFIPPDNIGGALHGDKVRVSVSSRSARGAEGRIEDIVVRRSPRVAGVLRRRGKSVWLEPDDTRLRGPVIITRVPKDAQDGHATIVDIQRFPLFAEELAEGEVVLVLGPPGDPQTEVQKILVREQIQEEHPEAALAEAERMAERLRELPLDGRRDLRHVPLPTIDPEDARDHDDALWVERDGKGFRAYIAIADVSEYVQQGSPLDDEARSRACTIYLPDRAIPMLPSALAADLCSLVPERDRYCLCVIADLDENGRVKDFEIVEAVMRSAAMLTYGGVARALGFDPESPQSAQAEAMKDDLAALADLSEKLRKARMKRGALDLDLPEAKVVVDPTTSVPTEVTKRATRPGIRRAYSMIEELMLLANELVAVWLTEKRVPAIYRVHGTPDEQKLERLAAVGETLGVAVDVDELTEPKGVSRWLNKIQKHPKKAVLETLLLRSLKQATYDIANVGHFGLASEHYLHFTSPIRRYPDLCVHRQVKQLLRGARPDKSTAAVEQLRDAALDSSRRERAAMDVEREVVDLYRALYMRDRVGDVLQGRVSAVTGGGLYVTLHEPFVDVLVRYEALGPDRYEISDDELSARGARSGDRVSLGDDVTVEIEDVALLRRTVYARRVVPEAVLTAWETGTPLARGFAEGATPLDRRARRLRRMQRDTDTEAVSSGRGARRFRGTTSAPAANQAPRRGRLARASGETDERPRRISSEGALPSLRAATRRREEDADRDDAASSARRNTRATTPGRPTKKKATTSRAGRKAASTSKGPVAAAPKGQRKDGAAKGKPKVGKPSKGRSGKER